jgi:membrane protease YdiL (CAAX protease family)
MTQATGPGDPAALTAPRPAWGFYETIGWGMIAFIAWFVAQTIVVGGLIAWQEAVQPGSSDLRRMTTDALSLAIITIVAGPVWIGVTAIAARWRRWAFADYMALVPPRRGELIFSVAALAVILVATDLLSYALGRPVIPQFMIDAYGSAQTPIAMVLLFVAIVVVAPICEEIAFRGFLFRGLSFSRFGAPGAIALTAAAWALMHVQYDWFVITQIFLLGIFLGWLRWATGSTLLTIVLHFIANLAAFAETVAKVEWLS